MTIAQMNKPKTPKAGPEAWVSLEPAEQLSEEVHVCRLFHVELKYMGGGSIWLDGRNISVATQRYDDTGD